MFLAELDACDFVVWTRKGILSVSVQYNKPIVNLVSQAFTPDEVETRTSAQYETDKSSTLVEDTEENLQLSIRYNGIDIYESCIETLKPQGLLNDNMVSVLSE